MDIKVITFTSDILSWKLTHC